MGYCQRCRYGTEGLRSQVDLELPLTDLPGASAKHSILTSLKEVQKHRAMESNRRKLYVLIALVALLVSGSVASGQQKTHAQVKVLTVCEVLANVNRYADRAVVVVGRMERSVSLTDHYEFLSQDQCEHPVITHGHVWSNKIQVWAVWEAGMPKPPRAKLHPEQSAVAAKLLAVRKTTKLGTHEEPYFKTQGTSLVYAGEASRPNEWVVVYGRIARLPRLNEDCGAEGCGGDNVPLMLIAEPYNVHGIAEDGRLLTEPQ